MSTKDQYVEKHQAEIEKLNAELKDLEVKITEAGADVKAKLEHEEHMTALRQKRDEAKAKLAEIQAAGDDAWEGLKDGLEHTWTAIKDGFEKSHRVLSNSCYAPSPLLLIRKGAGVRVSVLVCARIVLGCRLTDWYTGGIRCVAAVAAARSWL